MRIVHEVDAPMQVSAGRNGSRGHVFACSDSAKNHPDLPAGMFGDDELIEIEGDPKYIRQMLQEMLSALDAVDSAVSRAPVTQSA